MVVKEKTPTRLAYWRGRTMARKVERLRMREYLASIAVRMLAEKVPKAQVARWLGIAESTLRKWIKRGGPNPDGGGMYYYAHLGKRRREGGTLKHHVQSLRDYSEPWDDPQDPPVMTPIQARRWTLWDGGKVTLREVARAEGVTLKAVQNSLQQVRKKQGLQNVV